MNELGIAGIVSLEVGILSDHCLRKIQAEDKNCDVYVTKSIYKGILLYCIAVGIWIGCMLKHWQWYGQLCCGVVAAYLLVAGIQDMQTCQVYDFLHILALPTGILFLVTEPSGEKLVSLVVFVVVQLFLFMRMYGAADGMVLCVCSVYESRFGDGMLTFLLHMGAAYLLLAIVQGLRKNINRHGNLKEPVAFVPYIAATVWLFL